MSTVDNAPVSRFSYHNIDTSKYCKHNDARRFFSLSLYQQCIELETRLLRIRGFSSFLNIVSPSSNKSLSADPVSKLWDCFASGVPLCFIFNLLPTVTRIGNIKAHEDNASAGDIRSSMRAVMYFVNAIRGTDLIDHLEDFQVSDLMVRKGTDGLAKVSSWPYSSPSLQCDTITRLSNAFIIL